MSISFAIALWTRFGVLVSYLGNRKLLTTYAAYFFLEALIYLLIFLVKKKSKIERMSRREIILTTIEQQIILVFAFVMFFYIFQQEYAISRFVVGVFFLGNVTLCSLFRIIYRDLIIMRRKKRSLTLQNSQADTIARVSSDKKKLTQHVYIIGCKSIGLYGGFETFVMNLLKHHENNKNIRYHVACKANGQGFMDVEKLPGASRINDDEFTYCNVHGFLIKVPEIGSAQAIYYDLRALRWACDHIEKNHIKDAVVYILASRVGPFENRYVKRIHAAGGHVFQNPDGHEDWRRKWSPLIRAYWKYSERYAVKRADLIVCDSKNIEAYIRDEYSEYSPRTTYIAYGADIVPSTLSDDDFRFRNWLTEHNLSDSYYISVGRFVEENNFEIMIREFMNSHTDKDFAIITTENPKFADVLEQKLGYRSDNRIKFVGTVYDSDLLKKIRENAYGYFHGHEVGGTNPSLLESLASTNLNLILGVGFNHEVAEDSALYWTKEDGSLSDLIDKADRMTGEEIMQMGERARERIRTYYSWEKICDQYEDIFLNKESSASVTGETD